MLFTDVAGSTQTCRGERVKPSTVISAAAIGLIVTATILTDTWLYLLMAVAGVLFVVFAIAHPRPALLLWVLAAPTANTYATVNLPGGIPDIMFGRVTVVVVSVAILLRVMLKGRPLVAFGAVEFAMLGLLAVMTLDLLRSGVPTSDAMQDFDERVTPVLLFLAARNLCVRRADLRQAVYILAIVGCYLALHGAAQYLAFGRPNPTAADDVNLAVHEGGQRVNESPLGEGRAVGPFTNSVEYGSVTAITFLSALFLALYLTRGVIRAIPLAALPLIAAGVVMSSTRSAWLGGFVAVLLMALLDHRRKILLASIGAVTVVGLLAVVLFLPADSNLQERASALEPIRARLIMYEIGLTIAVRQPLTGYGRGAPSRIAARKELYATGNPDADLAPGQFHNIFLTSFVEWGIAGLIAYTAILVLIVKGAIQLRRRLADEQGIGYHFAGLVLVTTVVFVTQGLLVDTTPFQYLNGVYYFLAGLLFAQLDATAPVHALEAEPSRYGLAVNVLQPDDSTGP